jgi:hypothetical protein
VRASSGSAGGNFHGRRFAISLPGLGHEAGHDPARFRPADAEQGLLVFAIRSVGKRSPARRSNLDPFIAGRTGGRVLARAIARAVFAAASSAGLDGLPPAPNATLCVPNRLRDHRNVATRLEGPTKEMNYTMIVSSELAAARWPARQFQVRNRGGPV